MHRLRPLALRSGPLVVAVVVAVVAPSARGATWARPVAGDVTRPFAMHGSPFAAGQHRGVDLAAAAGATVGAPCGGRVVVAARIGSSRGVVTVACGRWRASVLPLARIGVRPGKTVRAGEAIGTAGEMVGVAGATSAHEGIHLGVRRADDPFGYVDPTRFFPRGHAPPLGPAPPPVAPRAPLVAPRAARVPPRASRASFPWRPSPATTRPVPLAPWPAWAGLALLLAGAASGVTLRARTRPRAATARSARARAGS